MNTTEIRKQISIFLPISDWRALRQAAANQQIPITELCRRWISPEIAMLRNAEHQPVTTSMAKD